MSHTKWLIDFDSVLSDTFGSQIKEVNAKFGTKYTRRTFTDWATEDILPPEQAYYMWGEIFPDYDFQLSVPPIIGAKEGVDELIEMGNELFVVSDRPESLRPATEEWLDRNIGHKLPVILTKSPHSTKVPSSDNLTKNQVIESYGIRKAIDDAPHHAEGFYSIPTTETVYMMDTPSNRHVNARGKLIRVYSWEHMLTMERERVYA